MFEINIPIRNALGDEVGRKSFCTESAAELAEWYEKNSRPNSLGVTTKKKKKKKKKAEKE